MKTYALSEIVKTDQTNRAQREKKRAIDREAELRELLSDSRICAIIQHLRFALAHKRVVLHKEFIEEHGISFRGEFRWSMVLDAIVKIDTNLLRVVVNSRGHRYPLKSSLGSRHAWYLNS